MKYITGESRNQIVFLPDCIEDYVGKDNPVRVVDAFVDQLSMDSLGFKRSKPNETGRPPYDPRDLLKIYIYGYFNKIRSSRKLMQECTRNLEVMYLIGKLVPDFRTISDFRKDNPKALKKVFKEFVKLCMKLNLYQRELLSIDGSKFRAQNSKDNCYNREVLEKKLENIENHISNYLIYLDKEDKNEAVLKESTPQQIEAAIQELTERKEKYLGYLEELEKSGETQLLTTDPDARRMHSKDGFHCSYNAQTAVDGGSHLIAGYSVDSKTDVGHLREVSDEAKELLEAPSIEVLADKGYASKEDILDCLMNGTIANVAIKEEKEERIFTIEYIEKEISEHPFGTVKWYNFGHYVLCRGREKVTAELGLCFLAYNLRRAINMVGVQKLIAAM